MAVPLGGSLQLTPARVCGAPGTSRIQKGRLPRRIGRRKGRDWLRGLLVGEGSWHGRAQLKSQREPAQLCAAGHLHSATAAGPTP